jgi:hypothetical protein
MSPKELIASRDAEYQGTWALHGEVTKLFAVPLKTLNIQKAPMYFPWNMILNKLIRILFSPMNKDHWMDIQGYAQLVLNLLESLDEQDTESNS